MKLRIVLILIMISTVIGCGKDENEGIDQNPPPQELPEEQPLSINGLWKLNNSWCLEIIKDKGYLKMFNTDYDNLNQYLKEGDLCFKSLVEIEDGIWEGEEIVWWNADFIYSDAFIHWIPCKIYLNKEKTQLTLEDSYGSLRFYRVENFYDPISKEKNFKQNDSTNITGVLPKSHNRVGRN